MSETVNGFFCWVIVKQHPAPVVNGLIRTVDGVMQHMVTNLAPSPSSPITLGGTSLVAGQSGLSSPKYDSLFVVCVDTVRQGAPSWHHSFSYSEDKCRSHKPGSGLFWIIFCLPLSLLVSPPKGSLTALIGPIQSNSYAFSNLSSPQITLWWNSHRTTTHRITASPHRARTTFLCLEKLFTSVSLNTANVKCLLTCCGWNQLFLPWGFSV